MPLSPEKLRLAQLIATGQVFIFDGHLDFSNTNLSDVPNEIKENYIIKFDDCKYELKNLVTLFDKPKEPWRRGRPIK